MTLDETPSELECDRMLALVLAGTVCLPSTPPASGDLYLTLNPEPIPDLTPIGLLPTPFLLKLVQVVSPLCTVTRTLPLKDLRAVTITRVEEDDAGREIPRRVTLALAQIAGHLEQASKDLGSGGQLLFPDAVIHVPESAPVLVRVESYYGVTAAEAAAHLAPNADICCH